MKWLGQYIQDLPSRFRDDVYLEGSSLYITHNAADYATFTVADTGDLTIATVGDGTRDSDLTLDADGSIKLEPVAGNNILLDGTIAIDAGVVTGATSITSTALIGALTGAASLNRAGRHYESTIKVLPSDFMANEEGGVTKTLQFVDDTASGLKAGNANTELLAFVAIPEGMKATLVDVYDNSHNLAVAVFEVDINSAGITSKGTGNANTQINITDVNATATNFLMIQVTTTALSERIFGALVTVINQTE